MTLGSFFGDLRYGVRQLVRTPGFALAAILSLGLGIGANTAIFTLVDQILLRLLPGENPEELVYFRVDGGRVGSQSGDGTHTFPYPTYLALRDQNTVFAGLAGQRSEPAGLTAAGASGEDRSEMIQLTMVTGNYFQVFGVRPHLGRTLTPQDDLHLNGHPVAVLQYDFWQSRFGGDPSLVGKQIRLNGTPFAVVGIGAPGYEGTDTGLPTRLWVPIAMKPSITPTDPRLDEERSSWFYLFARLKPGVTRTQAESAMKVLYRQRQDVELKHDIFTRFPQTRERFLKQTFSLEPAEKGASPLRRGFERPLIILQWLVGAVLLIACSNVAGLLLARGAARQRELAIRGAIGAGRGRILAQLLTESLLLAVCGGALGVGLGWMLTRFLLGTLPVDPTVLSISAAPDTRILVFTIVVTAITTFFFGLLPAWQSSRVSPSLTMREEGGGVVGGGAQVRLRKVFVGLQVALSVILLLGAGLFVQTLRNLRNVDLGMDTRNVVTFFVRPVTPYDAPRKTQVFRQVIESLAQVPGVAAVGANTTRLFTGGRSDGAITIPGIPENREPESFFNWVTPGYFEALRIPVRAGRDFTWQDWGSGRSVALVNDRLVSDYFPNTNPVGQKMGRGVRAPLDFEVIGVFGNSRYHDVRGAVPRQMFINLDSALRFAGGMNVYARASTDPARIMPLLRAQVARVDANLVVSDMKMLDDQINFRLANERLVSLLAGGFAVLATILALVGFSGVLSFVVARRTREIGIRMALGAGQANVVRLVAGEMTAVVLEGLAVGAGGAFSLGRFVETQLFGVKAADPVIFGLVVGTLLAASLVATMIPAARAARIEPMSALRTDA
ncbi:MAG: ABC transporter permease [Acidobacteria bacterium]|nr:ABC transporter permease [Acidobacteriota bacterium]